MKRFKKSICMLLALCVVFGMAAMSSGRSLSYSEDPLIRLNYAADSDSRQETVPAEVETLPEETVLQETTMETAAAEIPAETVKVIQAAQPVQQTQPAQETQPEQETQSTEVSEETQPLTYVEVMQTTSRLAQTKAAEADEPQGHNGVPLYFQTDYPDTIYGFDTVATSGCSATCLAMVATYLTGHEYLPDEIARYFGGAAENNIARLEYGSEQMQLPFKKAVNWHETLAAIQEGKLAIVLMGSTSVFTDSQHFIVVTGMNEEGKLMVNDPMESNYSKWDTKKGLREGFDANSILQGYSGAWIYDKSAMPEEPFIYSKPLPVRGEPRYDFELTKEEIQLLAKVVWVEARGECNEGQQAVAEVILNRLASDDFSDTLRGVIFSENQFRSAEHLEDAEPYQLQYEMIENALYGPYVLPEDVYYFATTAKTSKVWGQIGGHIFCYAED